MRPWKGKVMDLPLHWRKHHLLRQHKVLHTLAFILHSIPYKPSHHGSNWGHQGCFWINPCPRLLIPGAVSVKAAILSLWPWSGNKIFGLIRNQQQEWGNQKHFHPISHLIHKDVGMPYLQMANKSCCNLYCLVQKLYDTKVRNIGRIKCSKNGIIWICD